MRKKVINSIIGLAGIGLVGVLIVQKFNVVTAFYMEFQDVFLFMAYFETIEFILVVFSFFLFSILYWNASLNTKMYRHFQTLSLKNKVFFAWFTVVYAIPNKVIVNNKLSGFATSFIVFLILIISQVFPIFSLFYVIFWVTVLESYFFARLYKGKVSFRTFVDSKLFVNNLAFSQEYFGFFWGNMDSGGAGKTRAGFIGTALATLYRLAKNQEQSWLREQTKQEMARHIENAQEKPRTAEESWKLQKDMEAHIKARDCSILSTEDYIKKTAQKVSEYWS